MNYVPLKKQYHGLRMHRWINHKWSDAFKFVICETKWRRQAAGRIITVREAVETTLAVKRFLIGAAAGNVNGRGREEEFGSKKISTRCGLAY